MDLYTGNIKTDILANNVDPNELWQNVAFHQGLDWDCSVCLGLFDRQL